MTREDRKLRKHIEEHQRHALRKLDRRNPGSRWPSPPRPQVDLRTNWEAEPEEEIRPLEKRAPKRAAAPGEKGLITGIGPGYCQVLCAGRQLRCRSHPGLAVGDRVVVASRRTIERILPRATTLSRPDPHNPRVERVIAANIELAVIVCSVKAPPLRPGLIDRYLVAIERGGAAAAICVNKADLLDGDHELAVLTQYRALGIPVVLCSAATGTGLDGLLDATAGKLCVFVGHSGVGKSSLLNALHPGLDLATGAVSEATHKGRHTTSSSALYELPNGARIVDTPGIREFGLWGQGREDLRERFHEFDAHAPACRFADCAHTHEPDCAVKAAVEAGVIPVERYEAYCRVLASL